MVYDDDLDEEIDRDMGWVDKSFGKKGQKRRGPTLRDHLKGVWRSVRPLLNPLFNLGRAVRKVLFFPIISPLGYTKQFNIHGDMMVVKRPWSWRFIDALLTRALLTPIILAIFMTALVYATTHPARVEASSTPGSIGLYFQRVSIFTLDNERLAGWYVPPLTIDEMAFDADAMLTQKWPAVVICHGLGSAQDQYLSLAQELHNKGFAVLMLDMRGQGDSAAAPVTYGLRERLDVLAGVKYLRELPMIDGTKVCVIGRNIGATAALEAAALDSSISAVVADGLWPSFEDRAGDIFSRPFGSNSSITRWLAPLYTMAFEVALRDRVSQLNPETVVRNIHTQPVMFVARTAPECAPIPQVISLAGMTEAKHDVVLFDDNTAQFDAKARATLDRQICHFFVKATGWKGPKARGLKQIENLLKNQVQ